MAAKSEYYYTYGVIARACFIRMANAEVYVAEYILEFTYSFRYASPLNKRIYHPPKYVTGAI